MSVNWDKTRLPRLLKQVTIKPDQVQVGDVIIDREHGYPWQVTQVLNDGKDIGLLDEDDNGVYYRIAWIKSRGFTVDIIDRSCFQE